MNPNAFEILETLKLSHAKTYSLDETIESSREKFYLRFSRESPFVSRLVDKKEICNKKSELIEHIKSNQLLKIEDSFESIAGCTVYVNENGLYGEYVDGNLIA
ncbi:MAG: hypothetical protein HY818_01060 [Acetobacterium woodii]|nr:hypothetical protein [Acetobacterium woodii]